MAQRIKSDRSDQKKKAARTGSNQTPDNGNTVEDRPNILGGEQTSGRVAGYTVGRWGLIVHLDVGALWQLAFSVGPDEPHFRSAVSMAMVALNNRVNPATSQNPAADQQYLWVTLEVGTKGQKIRPAVAVAASYNNSADPFDTDAFVKDER